MTCPCGQPIVQPERGRRVRSCAWCRGEGLVARRIHLRCDGGFEVRRWVRGKPQVLASADTLEGARAALQRIVSGAGRHRLPPRSVT